MTQLRLRGRPDPQVRVKTPCVPAQIPTKGIWQRRKEVHGRQAIYYGKAGTRAHPEFGDKPAIVAQKLAWCSLRRNVVHAKNGDDNVGGPKPMPLKERNGFSYVDAGLGEQLPVDRSSGALLQRYGALIRHGLLLPCNPHPRGGRVTDKKQTDRWPRRASRDQTESLAGCFRQPRRGAAHAGRLG